MFKKLKQRWRVSDNWQFANIFLVFAVTGSTSAKITGPLLKTIPFIEQLEGWAFNIVYLFCTVIFYQFLLVFFGWLFGEFEFFWNFVSRLLNKLGLGSTFKP